MNPRNMTDEQISDAYDDARTLGDLDRARALQQEAGRRRARLTAPEALGAGRKVGRRPTLDEIDGES